MSVDRHRVQREPVELDNVYRCERRQRVVREFLRARPLGMRRLLMTFALISTVLFSVPTGATGTTKIPPNAIYPKGLSRFETPMAAAQAFGRFTGFLPRDPYAQGSETSAPGYDVITVTANGPTYQSAIYLERLGGEWYVTKVTSPVIQITSLSVGTTIAVSALAISALRCYAFEIDANGLTTTLATKMSRRSKGYAGPTTAIGPDNEVGVYSARIPNLVRASQWGFVTVLLKPRFDCNSDIWAAASVRVSR